MNIFYLDADPAIASKYHLDKHVVKMPLETAQILCTIHWLQGNEAPYKPTHKNHPCTIWVNQSIKNYDWVCQLGLELCKEYTFRYGKTHKCEAIINWCIENKPNLSIDNTQGYALAMPDEFKVNGDVVQSYRNYYKYGKTHLHSWKNREVPTWIS
jgi:hypothetical protein